MNKNRDKKLKLNSFKLADQVFFAQRLSLLLASGISLVESLQMISNMDTSIYRKDIYRNIIQKIENGSSLSKSITSLGVRFDNLLITLIKNGEYSGHLSEALSQAYIHLEKRNEMKKKILSSLMYPGFIVVATIGMALFLILYIFPKIIPLLKSLDIKLPLITRIVQWIYYSSISYGIWMILISVLLIISLKVLIKKNKYCKYKFHSFLLKIPFVGHYIKIYFISSICSMGKMLLAGVGGVPEMLTFSIGFSQNLLYKDAFEKVSEESNRGVALSISLATYKKLFPPVLVDMCLLGERTGNLGLMLGHCANIFDQDIENMLKKFSSLIEPVLMVFMGLIVGSIALSIILPVYEITNHLTK